MSTIYSVETTARILNAIREVSEAPEGYCWLPIDHEVAAGLTLAGFRNWYKRGDCGTPGRLVYTPAGYRKAVEGIPSFILR